jgi:hypothetical protein
MILSTCAALGFLSMSMAIPLPSTATKTGTSEVQTTLFFCQTWESLDIQQKANTCGSQVLENETCYDVRPWRENNSRNNVFVQAGRTCFTNSDKCSSIAGGVGRGPPWDSIGPDKAKPGIPWQAKLDTFGLDVVNIYCTG